MARRHSARTRRGGASFGRPGCAALVTMARRNLSGFSALSRSELGLLGGVGLVSWLPDRPSASGIPRWLLALRWSPETSRGVDRPRCRRKLARWFDRSAGRATATEASLILHVSATLTLPSARTGASAAVFGSVQGCRCFPERRVLVLAIGGQLPAPLVGAAAVPLKGGIAVVGGRANGRPVRTVAAMSPA